MKKIILTAVFFLAFWIITLGQVNQTITFDPLTNKTFGDPNFTLAASSTSGLTVSYSSSNTAVASITGNTVTIVAAGTTTITAMQGGDATYAPATPVARLLVVNKANQIITFGALPDKTLGDPNFTLTGTSSSGLTVSYSSSNSSVATVAGNTVTIKGLGSTTIFATQIGNANYNTATPVQQTLKVKLNQTITFPTIPAKTLGDSPFLLAATASSSLVVTFSTSSDKVSLAVNQLTMVKAGRVLISASQAGDGTYHPATPVDQSFCINPVKPSIVTDGLNTGFITLTSSAAVGNQWFLNGVSITGETSETIAVTGSNVGTYTVQITTDDCISEMSDPVALIITGDFSSFSGSVIAFPNPAEDIIGVSGLRNREVQAQISDLNGRIAPIHFEAINNLHRANVENLSRGVYIIRILDGGNVHQIKMIKK